MASAEFRPCPSRWLQYYLIASHLFVLLFTMLLPLSMWWRVVFVCLITGSLLWLLWSRRRYFPSTFSIRDGEWFLNSREAEQPAMLAGSYYASDWLIVFRLSPVSGASKTVVVARDSLDPDDYRRLRACLRLTTNTEQNF